MIVKICGITNVDDALAAVEAGARILGFNFYPPSPRYIVPEEAGRIAAAVPADVLKAGVFVNEAAERIAAIVCHAGLQIAQLHGDEEPGCAAGGLRVWKAFRVDESFQPERLGEWAGAEAVLLDGPAEALYGGCGKTFPWAAARGLHARLVVAGGLDASNVRAAIEQARPWAVDACSRLESAPGRKDHKKLREFLKAALG